MGKNFENLGKKQFMTQDERKWNILFENTLLQEYITKQALGSTYSDLIWDLKVTK